jgi:hypothetical protein
MSIKVREMSPATVAQLTKWSRFAKTWPSYLDGDYRRCEDCSQAIYRVIDPSGISYRWSDDERLSMTVAHLRRCHSEKEAEFV